MKILRILCSLSKNIFPLKHISVKIIVNKNVNLSLLNSALYILTANYIYVKNIWCKRVSTYLTKNYFIIKFYYPLCCHISSLETFTSKNSFLFVNRALIFIIYCICNTYLLSNALLCNSHRKISIFNSKDMYLAFTINEYS